MSDLSAHYLESSLRAKLVEHLLVGDLLKVAWVRGDRDIEVLQPEVDRSGYDVVIETKGTLRHIQLKTSKRTAKTAEQKVHTSLASKPSGCLIWVLVDEETLEMGPFRWFGGAPGGPLPQVSDLPTAKHTKANADGVKAERPAIRRLAKAKFRAVEEIEELYNLLFGGPND